MKKKDIEYFVDGKPASLLEIAESSGDDKVLKSFLQRTGRRSRQSGQAADSYLRNKLGGDYMTAREVNAFSRIKPRILEKWRNQGIIRAEQFQGIWYYSKESLLAAIKSAPVEDITS